MEIFLRTLEQMGTVFLLMAVGFILRKTNILGENADKVIAKLETYIFCPALALYTQMTKCTVPTFVANSRLILYGTALILGAIILSYPLSKLFVPNYKESSKLDYQRSIYKYALTFGNFGFLGNFLALSVWGSDFFYLYSLFTLTVNILCYGWGIYILVPKEQNAGVWASVKNAVTAPGILALVIGIVLGLTGLADYVPSFVTGTLKTAGDCMGPVAMVLAGIVIGGYDFKELLNNKKVYIATALRLFVIPGVILLILKALRADETLLSIALIAFATPLGMNTIVFPASYGGDTKTGASMAMISHVLSVATIPLMYLLFVVLL